MEATLPHAEKQALGYRFATVVSYIVNPLVLPPIEFGFVLWHFGAGSNELGIGIGVGLVFFFLLPLLFVAGMVHRGAATTLEVRRRQARTLPFGFGIGSYLLGIAVLWMFLQTQRPLVLTLAALYPINTALIALINMRWKISVHATSIAGLFAALLFVGVMSWSVPTLGVLTLANVAPWIVLVPLVMWARIRSGAHTAMQVVGGALLGFGLTLIELYVATSAFL